jgi:hypothetical protein
MKIIKSQNYIKKALRNVNETDGIIKDLNNQTVDVTVYFYYTPSTPDVFYLKNGDPGYP